MIDVAQTSKSLARRTVAAGLSIIIVMAAGCCPAQAADVQGQNIIGPGEGRVLLVLGEAITVKIGGEQTGGRYAVFEEVSPVGGGPPLHVHRHDDEVFYVLEGELEFQLGAQRFPAKAGTSAFFPKTIAHTFRNIGPTPSKVLVMVLPARLVRFFEEVDALAKPTPERVMELGRNYDLTFLPAPKPDGARP